MTCHCGSRLDGFPALMDYRTSNCEFACEPESPLSFASDWTPLEAYFVMSHDSRVTRDGILGRLTVPGPRARDRCTGSRHASLQYLCAFNSRDVDHSIFI